MIRYRIEYNGTVLEKSYTVVEFDWSGPSFCEIAEQAVRNYFDGRSTVPDVVEVVFYLSEDDPETARYKVTSELVRIFDATQV